MPAIDARCAPARRPSSLALAGLTITAVLGACGSQGTRDSAVTTQGKVLSEHGTQEDGLTTHDAPEEGAGEPSPTEGAVAGEEAGDGLQSEGGGTASLVAGAYRYASRGTFTYGPNRGTIEEERLLELKAAGGGRWQYSTLDSREERSMTTEVTAEGVLLVALRSHSALVTFEFEPSEPPVEVPGAARPGDQWSFALTSTDGCYRQTTDRRITAVRSDETSGSGEVWDIGESGGITTVGPGSCVPVSMTVERDVAYARERGVALAVHERADGHIAGFPVSVDRTDQLASGPGFAPGGPAAS